MKKLMTSQELARDSRFKRVPVQSRALDRRLTSKQKEASQGKKPKSRNQFSPDHPDAPDRARSMMHGIFVGEIQALEGAGRTCWDFDTSDKNDAGTGTTVPFALKLDMARQCWDEARHCEISVKLGEHMGTTIGEFGESAFLFEAACNPDPILRLAGVNRALEGLAIDVFNTMKEFGASSGDPVLEFCEDWMLADEVTHVKMGSDWLRKGTVDDPERRDRAIEFQRIVDKLFSGGGFRGDDESSPIKLARRFRELAGFDKTEIDEIAMLSKEALEETKAQWRE